MAATAQKKSTTAKKSASGRSGGAKAAPAPRYNHLIWAGVFLFLSVFFFAGYFSVDALLVNPVCSFVKGLIGYGYYVFPAALLAASVVILISRGRPVEGRVFCLMLFPLLLGALVQVPTARLLQPVKGEGSAFLREMYVSGVEMESGGILSGVLGWGGHTLLGNFLSIMLLLILLLALLMVAFRISPKTIAERMHDKAVERREIAQRYDEEEAARRAAAREAGPVLRRQDKASEAAAETRIQRRNLRRAIDIPVDGEALPEPPAEKPAPRGRAKSEPVPSPAVELPPPVFAVQPVSTEDVAPLSMEQAADMAGVTLAEPVEEKVKTEEISTEVARSIRTGSRKGLNPDELMQETEEVARAVVEKDARVAAEPDYIFPPVKLLHAGGGGGVDAREEINMNRARLQATLDSFGVNAAISDITRGPTVTRYDLELEAGVKLAKLTNLAGDLALSLGVTGVRIAPIPDKISTVGIEVPNKLVSTVYLRDIIDTEPFRNASSKLSFAIGEDIGGNAIVGNIAKLPHLLIAGTTGSGKSVCMNCLILSLLYKATPEEVRLIMIDPKMVELGVYNGIPHLYIPVVTDPKKAAGSLQWAVVEMLKRYRLFSEAGIRDLAGYNTIQKRNGAAPLPQVVIVIDELADLMMVASKEVEESICRVAQMGRAAGMHLVIATQRPSADVITGLMKANIPSRIAFAVSSSMESRIILDQMGAEKLVGSGDMLYAPIGIGKPNRIQGAFVTDEEREEIVGFIKRNSEANYNEEIMHSIEQAAAEKDSKDKGASRAESVDEPEEEGYDELLPQAVEVIFETKQASVSMLQRRLKLGYSRAARIVDQMERIGVVGPFEGSKPRQILLTREQWLEMQTVQGTAPTEKVPSFADYKDDAPEDWQ
ncbi:MAG: DNA translocase FtsK [Oscillospiraceae bacterium]|nr:DNA translocase FtsK [Oscillospiraceae bacterium]